MWELFDYCCSELFSSSGVLLHISIANIEVVVDHGVTMPHGCEFDWAFTQLAHQSFSIVVRPYVVNACVKLALFICESMCTTSCFLVLLQHQYFLSSFGEQ